MKYLDLTFTDPYANVACDEALLNVCESGFDHSILRFWESDQYFVVLGISNKINQEADLAACTRDKIPVLRRCSGGGTVLQGPGCFNYSLILKIEDYPQIKNIQDTHKFVLEQHRQAFQPYVQGEIRHLGICDLAINRLKFSGNAQRRKKRFVLYHGTLLLDFDLHLIRKYLRMPEDQPEYRNKRSHQDFLINLSIPADIVKQILLETWGSTEVFREIPHSLIDELIETKYATNNWTYKF